MIMFIADAIQAILGVCEPAMSFIRTVVALNTYSLDEVSEQPHRSVSDFDCRRHSRATVSTP
jgi:hypothetical protein